MTVSLLQMVRKFSHARKPLPTLIADRLEPILHHMGSVRFIKVCVAAQMLENAVRIAKSHPTHRAFGLLLVQGPMLVVKGGVIRHMSVAALLVGEVH